MENVEKLFDKAVLEIERILSTKTAVGEQIEIENNTLIPLVSVGFGFGVGMHAGADSKKGHGQGGGTGGGGGIKPIALVVVNKNGVRVEPVMSGTASVLETAVKTIGQASAAKNDKIKD